MVLQIIPACQVSHLLYINSLMVLMPLCLCVSPVSCITIYIICEKNLSANECSTLKPNYLGEYVLLFVICSVLKLHVSRIQMVYVFFLSFTPLSSLHHPPPPPPPPLLPLSLSLSLAVPSSLGRVVKPLSIVSGLCATSGSYWQCSVLHVSEEPPPCSGHPSHLQVSKRQREVCVCVCVRACVRACVRERAAIGSGSLGVFHKIVWVRTASYSCIVYMLHFLLHFPPLKVSLRVFSVWHTSTSCCVHACMHMSVCM